MKNSYYHTFLTLTFLLAVISAYGEDAPAGWEAAKELVAMKSADAANNKKTVNYQEAAVPKYHIPDPLVLSDGTVISKAETWFDKRRPEILEQFLHDIYGRAPVGRPDQMTFTVFDNDPTALDGRATRKQIRISFTGKPDGPGLNLLIYLPNQVQRPVPTFLTIEFHGTQTLHTDPAILVSDAYFKARGMQVDPKKMKRGSRADHYPIETILARGYGFAAFCYGDVAPDRREGFQTGVYPAFDKAGQRPSDAWGAISAWAWAASRVMDYFEQDDDIDHKRVAVQGLSRLGKTALWTGALDTRFSMAISTCSGCCGAALSRRRYGETIHDMLNSFSYWTCANFMKYDNNEDQLPIDQHMLIALMAPRAVYVSSADADLWADPRGEFLSCVHATPVYHLLGEKGLEAEAMPALNTPIQAGHIGYHIRTGGHTVNEYDWQQYLNFADKFLK